MKGQGQGIGSRVSKETGIHRFMRKPEIDKAGSYTSSQDSHDKQVKDKVWVSSRWLGIWFKRSIKR